MQWMVPKAKLDKIQTGVLNSFRSCPDYFYVSGEPGTGKSVLLVHFVREMLAMYPNKRICVLTFTRALVECLSDGLRMPDVPITTFSEFLSKYKRTFHKFDLIVVDEVQDMRQEWANCIQKKAKKVLFFGDYGQTLYEDTMSRTAFLGQFQPVSKRLEIIHRLSPSCRNLVNALFPESQIKSTVSNLEGDAEILLFHANGWDEEFQFACKCASKYAQISDPVGMLFRHKKQLYRMLHSLDPQIPMKTGTGEKTDFNEVNAFLRDKGSPFRFLGNGFGNLEESDSTAIVYLMTWHSSKGLDFDTIFLPFFDKAEENGIPLYVALTRSRRNLIISYGGRGDDVLDTIRNNPRVKFREVDDWENGADRPADNSDDSFIF